MLPHFFPHPRRRRRGRGGAPGDPMRRIRRRRPISSPSWAPC